MCVTQLHQVSHTPKVRYTLVLGGGWGGWGETRLPPEVAPATTKKPGVAPQVVGDSVRKGKKNSVG